MGKAERGVDCGLLLSILKPLEDPYSDYYSDGMLNSEGMTLLSRALAIIMGSLPQLSSMARKARERREYFYVKRLIDELEAICAAGHGEVQEG